MATHQSSKPARADGWHQPDNAPRSLYEAARQLESKLGTAISYADVALVYSGDYAGSLARLANRTWETSTILRPRTAPFDVLSFALCGLGRFLRRPEFRIEERVGTAIFKFDNIAIHVAN